jgi:hypothetical protein
MVDLIVFGPQNLNQSEGRYPDSAADILFPVPTPGKRNALPPDFLGVTMPGAGTMQVTFSTEPTHIYQVESTSDLSSWTNWGAPINATGTSATVNLPQTDKRRFWRVTIVP